VDAKEYVFGLIESMPGIRVGELLARLQRNAGLSLQEALQAIPDPGDKRIIYRGGSDDGYFWPVKKNADL
jgi:hypothetical protein